MPLFKSNHRPNPPAPGGAPVAQGSARSSDEALDWRSYDTVAAAYARAHAPRTAMVANDLVDMAGIGPGDRVLDVGAGTGVGAAAAAARSALAVATDPSVAMLAAGSKEAHDTRYVAATAIDLPFRDATFSHVLTLFALTHFTKYDTALFDMLRVLRPGGRMGVAVWGRDDDEFSRAWAQVAEEFAEKEILSDARDRAMPWADRFADVDTLKGILHDAGLRDMVVERQDYHFQMTVEDYVAGREALSTGRFLREMLGPEMWKVFQRRAREVFAERFPDRFNDFRRVILVVGFRP